MSKMKKNCCVCIKIIAGILFVVLAVAVVAAGGYIFLQSKGLQIDFKTGTIIKIPELDKGKFLMYWKPVGLSMFYLFSCSFIYFWRLFFSNLDMDEIF